MKKNMITRALAGTVLISASLSTSAVVAPFNVGFVTIQDLEITQNNALSFGQNVIGTAASTCTMDVNVLAANNGNNGTIPNADIEDAITGTGCLAVATGAGNNLAGVYTVKGQTDQSFTLTLGSVATGGDFSFSPKGFMVRDDSAVTFATATILFADTPTSGTLGDSAAFQMGVVVGGTITIGGTDLVANTPYTANYNITATY
ncbi:hypothetical protein [Pseudoalteromonas denitrificans]|uniref:DUF4402 domain-containing protein n=1 Tax=Pseudoalteromonas denitrificans DSM 6059 TaxID=1123010 RepID=A0A1I1HX57_9GAMM|nr:hypothetical protein [Pseudoalteromonas denitrificans]SFC25540.1 hypothetical protein SAMN02745724_01278 [Pseudoalteromonas denitrificans DSM 6059]